MRQRRTIASVAALATMGGTALLALANPSVASPNSGLPTLTPKSQANYTLVKGSDGATHALVPTTVLPRPAGAPANASPATLAKAYLAAHARSFKVTNPATNLTPTRTALLGKTGSTVKFQQKLDGIPVLGGQLIVSMDVAGNLQSITGETATGSVSTTGLRSGSLKSMGNVENIRKVQAWVNHAAGHTVKGLQIDSGDQWIVNPQLVGIPNGSDVNIATTRYTAHNASHTISYTAYLNDTLGVVYGYANTDNVSSNHRLICDANSDRHLEIYECQDHVQGEVAKVVRKEGGKKAKLADANAAYRNLGLAQLTFARYTNTDLTKLIGLSNKQVTGSAGTVKKLRATVRYCDNTCPSESAHWFTLSGEVTAQPQGGFVYFGQGMATKDVTGHELAHGVTQQTSNLFYMYQSGAISESLSDTFGELMDLSNKIKGSKYDEPKYDWLLGEGSSLGVARSMRNPSKAPTDVGSLTNFVRQPDRMTSKLWYDAPVQKSNPGSGDDGGVHHNSGVGNKAAYLIAHGGSFNGKTVRGLGYAKTFKIYWSLENLLSSGADYKDLAVTLPIACNKAKADPASYLTKSDCNQVKKATVATEMYRSPVVHPPVSVPYCPTGKTVKASLSQGFDHKPVKGWTHVYLSAADFDTANAVSGADSAELLGSSEAEGFGNNLTLAKAHKIPAGSWLRLDYELISDDQTASLLYKVGDGAWKPMPTVKTTVNPAPWTSTSGWSSAKFSLVPLKGKNVKFRIHVQPGDTMSNYMWVDNFKIYTCKK